MIKRITKLKPLRMTLNTILIVQVLLIVIMTFPNKWTYLDTVSLIIGFLEMVMIILQNKYFKNHGLMAASIINIILLYTRINLETVSIMVQTVYYIGIIISLFFVVIVLVDIINGNWLNFFKVVYTTYVSIYAIMMFGNGIVSPTQDANTRLLMVEGLSVVLFAILIWHKFPKINMIAITIYIVIIGAKFVMNVYYAYPKMIISSLVILLFFVMIVNDKIGGYEND